MSARLGSYPLFTWHSNWGARSLLEKGIRWRMGNGELVNIWNDALLSKPGKGRIECQNININYTTVSDLIHKETFNWKVEDINNLFSDEQAGKIRSVPLVNTLQTNEFVWRGGSFGVYTAKNGYRWLVTEEQGLLGNNDTI
ncbi:hypothetical protein V6Z12_A01G096600 [Gossypium hirsutum]